MIKSYDPYSKYATNDSISLDIFEEEWTGNLVEPRHHALHEIANLDPFANNDIDWRVRETEMFITMAANKGIGLAAPQLGSNYNMFVMDHSIMGNIGVFKPEILERSEETVIMEEGCLSFPILYLKISRPERIRVRYYKSDGETIVETDMDGRDARCFLHEYDHLQGRLFIDLVSDFKLRRAKEKQDKFFRKVERNLRG